MSEDLGRAELELSTDQSRLNRGLDQSKTKTLGFLRDVQKSFREDLSKSLGQGIGQGFGQKAFSLAEQGLRGILEGASGAIEAASNLRESMSLAGQVFEGNQGQMAAWADGAAKAFGQSKREALNFASSFGTTFKNVGFSLDETAEKSQVLTRLAADLGSAFNASSEEAAIALRSGLLGESEPLRRFGVFLSEAAVQEKAVAMGIAKVGEKLTDNQKVMARYAIILDQTKDSQGMFGRDTDSLADAQKTLGAQVENLGAKIGAVLIPTAKSAVDVAIMLVDNWDQVAPILGAIAAAILVTLIPALFRLGAAAIAATGPFAPLAAILAAVGVAMAQGAADIDHYKAKIAELEKAGPGFLDFGYDDRLRALKAKLAEMEAAQAEAVAKEKARLQESAAFWRAYAGDVGNAIDDVAAQFGIKDVPGVVDDFVGDIEAGLKSGKYKLENGALVMASGIPAAVKTQGAAAVVAARQSIADMATAIKEGRREIVDAMNDVVDEAYDPLILAAEITATRVELAEQRKIVASKSSTAAEKREANLRILNLEKTLATQLNEQTQYGTDSEILAKLTGRATSRELIEGLKSGDKARRLASKNAATEIASGIIALMNRTKTYGIRTGNAYVDGLIAAFEERVASARRAFNPYRTMFVASSPPGPGSPLHKIDVWGYRTGEAWVLPMIRAIAGGRDAMRAQLGRVAGVFEGRRLPRLTLPIGQLAPSFATSGGAMAPAGAVLSPTFAGDRGGVVGRSITKQYIQKVTIEGKPKARDPLGVTRALIRVAKTGELERAYGEADDE